MIVTALKVRPAFGIATRHFSSIHSPVSPDLTWFILSFAEGGFGFLPAMLCLVAGLQVSLAPHQVRGNGEEWVRPFSPHLSVTAQTPLHHRR